MKKVYVGMSGGVDSSLTAALLVEAGYDVTGVYMKNWSKNLPGMNCPWARDLADAKRVAVKLGIDFKVFDFEKEYKDRVVDYMINEYKAGRTPNPDIMCNQEVKFNLFLEMALKDGADLIATGHYAKTKNGKLYLAEDTLKDQTYFLYRVTKEALDKTLFPLGEFTKDVVREMAKERGLITASKKDSQGICFVGEVGIREFLSNYVEPSLGDIVDKKTGKVLGKHDGAIFYTLGQRHGLDIGGGLPYYVSSKDMEKNIIYVTTNLNDDVFWKKEIELNHLHQIDKNNPFINGKEYYVRVRHRAPLVKATFKQEDGKKLLIMDSPERAVMAGQSVVIYDDKECLGGGIVV